MLLGWLSTRDPNGVLRNAIAYKKHASHAAKRIHRETKLVESKPEVTPKMISNKLRTMNSTYRKVRSTVEITGWGVDPAGHDEAIDGLGSETIRSWVLKRCAWYYDFETLFGSSPNVSAPFLSESGQPDRVNSRSTGEEEDEKENNTDKDDEAIEWEAISIEELRDGSLGDAILDEEIGRELEGIQRSKDIPSTQDQTSINQSTAPTRSALLSASTRTPKSSYSETPPAKIKAKRKKPRKATAEVSSSSEEERSAKKGKNSRSRTVADAMIEVERIRDAARIRGGEVQAELQKIRFEAEQKQRDQQYKILLQQGQERIMLQKETLLRLQLQLKGCSERGR